MGTIVTIVSIVTALAAAVAAAVYAHYALVTSKAAVLSDWLKQYSDDEMGSAMALLRSWQEKHGSAFPEQYRKAIREMPHDAETQGLLAARRRVSQFFKNLGRLSRTKLLDDVLIARAFGKRPFDFCVETLDPLDQAHSQEKIGEPDDPYWMEFYRRVRQKASDLGVI